MKSKTKVSKQIKKKKNPKLVETILICKKNEKWLAVASILSGPTKKRINANLEEIDKIAKDNEIIVVPGKVLSQGDITKKIKISAFNFSEKAKQKLLNSKIDFSYIISEVKSNPEGKNIKIITEK